MIDHCQLPSSNPALATVTMHVRPVKLSAEANLDEARCLRAAVMRKVLVRDYQHQLSLSTKTFCFRVCVRSRQEAHFEHHLTFLTLPEQSVLMERSDDYQ